MDWKKLSSKKIVLAGGVFDIIHPGHIHTLNAAKALGDVLVVAIATDKTAKKMKKRQPLHSQELRHELVSSLSMVDVAVIGNEDDIFETVKLVKPDVIALGYDQRLFSTDELEAKLLERGLKVKAVRFPEMEQDLAGSRKIISKIMMIYRKKYGSE